MAMWAGVQKLSRPMERCQETSQCAPMVTEVTASAAHQRYHGMRTTLLVRGFAVRVAMLRFPPLPDEDRIQRDAAAGVAPYRKRGRVGWIRSGRGGEQQVLRLRCTSFRFAQDDNALCLEGA